MKNLFKKLLSSFLVCAITVSCLTKKPPCLSYQHNAIVADVKVFISPEFTESERKDIISGIIMWEKSMSGMLKWNISEYNEIDILELGQWRNGIAYHVVVFDKTTSTTEMVRTWDLEHNKTVIGMCLSKRYYRSQIWLVSDRLYTSQWWRIVSSHEFGHAIGLPHIKDEDSVMSEYIKTTTSGITEYDLQEICKVYNCNICIS